MTQAFDLPFGPPGTLPADLRSEHTLMREVYRLVEKVKDSTLSVLIHGESGTGKELIARALHYTGCRAGGPFTVVNCASIPRTLLESELFGHERGAFTDAMQRKTGKFELADGGTIFLDEMGELDLGLQAKLLRVIESRSFERVGGTESVTSDFRVVSASNRDLRAAVRQGLFREDLYFRLASFVITIPPLRERHEDIFGLAELFLLECRHQHRTVARGFTHEALLALVRYQWPGNVRELKHAVEYAALMAEGGLVGVTDLPATVQRAAETPDAPAAAQDSAPGAEGYFPLETTKEEAVRQVLRRTGFNIQLAARELGVARSTLYAMMRRYGIRAPGRTAAPDDHL